MRRLRFVKMSGAGNDFVLLERGDVKKARLSPAALARKLCARRDSVGADGLLIVRPPARGKPPAVDYYNPDGSPAFCGNGSRCAAWWMRRRGWGGAEFPFRTIAGLLKARVPSAGHGRTQARAQILMPAVRGNPRRLKARVGGRTWSADLIDTGVPHAVVEVRDVAKADVAGIGSALRKHPVFGARGTNVDFLELRRNGSGPILRMRTYERGVEGETLACGTGAVACAVHAHVSRGLLSPLRIRARSGAVLTARLRGEGGRVREVWLEGPVRLTFEGEIAL